MLCEMNLQLIAAVLAIAISYTSASSTVDSEASQLEGKKLTSSLHHLVLEYVEEGINWDRDWTACHASNEEPTTDALACVGQQNLSPELIDKVGQKVLDSLIQSHKGHMQKGILDGDEEEKEKQPAKHALKQVVPALRASGVWAEHGKKSSENIEWFKAMVGNNMAPAFLLDAFEAFDLWTGPVQWMINKAGPNVYSFVLYNAQNAGWIQEHARGIQTLIEAFPPTQLEALVQKGSTGVLHLAQNLGFEKFIDLVVNAHGDRLLEDFALGLHAQGNNAAGATDEDDGLAQFDKLSHILSHTILTALLSKTKEPSEDLAMEDPQYKASRYTQFMFKHVNLHAALYSQPDLATKYLMIPTYVGPEHSGLGNILLLQEATELLIHEPAMPRALWNLLYGWTLALSSGPSYFGAHIKKPFKLEPQTWTNSLRILSYGWKKGTALECEKLISDVFSWPAFGHSYFVHFLQSEILLLKTIELSEIVLSNGKYAGSTVTPIQPVPALSLLIEPSKKHPWVVDAWALALRTTKPSDAVRQHLKDLLQATEESYDWWPKLKPYIIL